MTSESRTDRAQQIAALNDDFRRTFVGGVVLVTAGVQSLGCDAVNEALAAVRAFDTFDEANDPYAEHDFGSITIEGMTLFWKIDYYDPLLEHGSTDAADPDATRRVLTVMLAEEY